MSINFGFTYIEEIQKFELTLLLACADQQLKVVDGARSLLKLMDDLEDSDDVQSVIANFEMAAQLML